MLVLVSIAEFLAMSMWFSFSAIKPLIADQWDISNTDAGLVLAAFQTGYIVGVPVFGYLADAYDVRKVFAFSALVAAVLSVAFAWLSDGLLSAMAIRFFVGLAIGGVYTPAIRFLTLWFEPRQRGKVVGILVGALVAGSASPYLLSPLAETWGWQSLVYITVGAAVTSAVIMLFIVPKAPAPIVPASRSYNFRILKDKPIGLINAGYVSHMWELYAMWAWIGPFLVYTLTQKGFSDASSNSIGGLIAFFIVAIGAPASAMAGIFSDRMGRTVVAGSLLATSGIISLFFGFMTAAPLVLIVVVGLVYGFAIVGDSPVFSAAVTELAPSENVGAALGIQSLLGFGITIISTAVFGVLVDWVGWNVAFFVLGIGALIGTGALVWLRRLPASIKMAGGRR